MATVTKTVEVAKELSELFDGLAGMVGAVVESQKDGWQIGEDLPAILTAAMVHLSGAVDGITKISEEKKDLESFVKAAALGISDIAKAAGAYGE